MGNNYRKDHHRRLDGRHRSMFLPMLCARPSVKTVAMPRSGSFSDEAIEPVSPEVGCMGQVKKRNGRVVGFPTTYKITNHGSVVGAIKANACKNIVMSCSNGKYSKLKKLFSSRSLIWAGNSPSSAAKNVTASAAGAARTRRRSVSKSGSFGLDHNVNNSKEAVNIGEMDPPLPVVKKVRKPEEEEGGSLWQRRFGGVAPDLQSLEIRHDNPRHRLRLVTV